MKTIRQLLVLFLLTSTLGVQAQTSLTQAVDFDVTDLHGDDHNLFSYLDDGKYVVIDFFAYWCGPCQITAPDFNEVYHMYGCNQGDVIFISLEYEGTEAQTEEFESLYTGEDGPPTVSGIDGGAAAPHSAYGIAAFPTFILIAPDHSIVQQDIWPLDTGILDDVLSSYNLSHQECGVVGVEDVEASTAFNLYPNPATSSIHVDLDKDVYDVIVYNVLGEAVITLSSLSGRQTIDTSELSTGSYLVKIFNEEDSNTQRLSIIK